MSERKLHWPFMDIGGHVPPLLGEFRPSLHAKLGQTSGWTRWEIQASLVRRYRSLKVDHPFRNISLSDYFSGKQAVLATMHGKEQVIAPLLEKIGLQVVVSKRINTDLFGTFSGEVERPAPQLETLRLKAGKCLEIHPEHPLALASEGAFNSHPASPFTVMHTELVMLKDRSSGLEVIGSHVTLDFKVRRKVIARLEELDEFLNEVSYPEYGVILKSHSEGKWRVAKDFQTRDEVFRAFETQHTETGEVTVESDLRAHRNPRRMKIIGEATRDLIEKLESRCPDCEFPGFSVTVVARGLPCEECGAPTRGVLKEILTCACCGGTEERFFPQGKERAPAGTCDHCNP